MNYKSISLILILLFLAGYSAKGQDSENLFNADYFEAQRFAHRGGYASGIENTIATILDNLEREVTAMEIDLRMTGDGKLVLFHDETVDRLLVAEAGLSISELSLEHLKAFPFKEDLSQRVSTLSELFDTLAIYLPANNIKDFLLELDFKPHGKSTKKAVHELDKLIRKYELDYGGQIYNHFFVSSFYPEVIKALHRKNPEIRTAFAINSHPEQDRLGAKIAVLLAPSIVRKYEVEIIEPHLCMVTADFVNKWHRRGVLINAYTANTKCEKDYLEQFSIAYTTNCPLGFCDGDPSDAMGPPFNWCKKCVNKK